MSRVLLLLPTTTYKTPDFLAAARELQVDVTVASEEPSTLESLNPEGLLTLDFRDPEECARRAAQFARKYPVDAVVGVDEDTAVATAVIARALGLPHNPVHATVAARHKATMRQLLAEAAVPSPGHRVFDRDADPRQAAKQVRFPCVLKPTFLAASCRDAMGIAAGVGAHRPASRRSRHLRADGSSCPSATPEEVDGAVGPAFLHRQRRVV